MPRMEMRCGNTKCERCGKESVITIWHKSYDANLCGDCYKDADKNKKLFLTGVEVAPVIHAHWIEDCGDYKCSHCSTEFWDEMVFIVRTSEHEFPNYCPVCGAKMDGVE